MACVSSTVSQIIADEKLKIQLKWATEVAKVIEQITEEHVSQDDIRNLADHLTWTNWVSPESLASAWKRLEEAVLEQFNDGCYIVYESLVDEIAESELRQLIDKVDDPDHAAFVFLADESMYKEEIMSAIRSNVQFQAMSFFDVL